jgi:hypothetical protein
MCFGPGVDFIDHLRQEMALFLHQVFFLSERRPYHNFHCAGMSVNYVQELLDLVYDAHGFFLRSD